jgi:hypothetical protein
MKNQTFIVVIIALTIVFGISFFLLIQTKETKNEIKHSGVIVKVKTKETENIYEKTINQTVNKTKEKSSHNESEMNKHKNEKLKTGKVHHKMLKNKT